MQIYHLSVTFVSLPVYLLLVISIFFSQFPLFGWVCRNHPWSPLMLPDDMVMTSRNFCNAQWELIASLPLDDHRCVMRLHPDSPAQDCASNQVMRVYPGYIQYQADRMARNLPLQAPLQVPFSPDQQPDPEDSPPSHEWMSHSVITTAREWLEPWSLVPAADGDESPSRISELSYIS